MTVADRLGVAPFGTKDPKIGNYLLYPRRVILEVLKLALQQENLFAPLADPGSVRDRNQFYLKYDASGNLSPASLVVLSDSHSDRMVRGDARPRIAVDRGPGSFTQTGFSRTKAVWPDSKVSAEIFESSVTIDCRSSKRIESELLAMVVSGILMFFQDTIREKSALLFLSTPQISPTLLETGEPEMADSFNTRITLSVSQSLTWVTKQINPQILAEIGLHVETISVTF